MTNGKEAINGQKTYWMCDNFAGAEKTLWIIKNNECCNEVDDDGLVDGDKFLSLQ